MTIVLIAAIAEDGTIGHAGKIPWHIPDDLKRFKRLTLGHTVIMGRKTFQSIGKPLAGRRNIIVTRQPGPDHFPSLEAALKSCADTETVFVIGGAELYRAALPLADKLLLTHVNHPGGGDTKFPHYDKTEWKELAREDTPYGSFVEYHRVSRHL
jgi:dihydrofolate reductase